jgi:hypothetical protein
MVGFWGAGICSYASLIVEPTPVYLSLDLFVCLWLVDDESIYLEYAQDGFLSSSPPSRFVIWLVCFGLKFFVTK